MASNGSLTDADTTKNGQSSEVCPNSDENVRNEMKEVNEESINEAMVTLEHGIQLLRDNDFKSAAEVLLAVCCKCCEAFGDLADECGEPYFLYGCTLLELAVTAKRIVRSHVKGKKTKEEDGEVKADCVDGSQSHQDPPRVESTINVENEGTEDMEPVDKFSDGQLAKEMLELAKVIFLRLSDEKKLIQIYSKLSDADLFLGNYTSAAINSQKCLALCEKQQDPAEREVAETLFQLGTACSLSKEYYSAVKYFTSSGAILERHIRHLLQGSNDDDSENVYAKVHEIKDLLQNIKDKICDVEELIRESMRSNTRVDSSKIVSSSVESQNGSLPDTTEMRANVISCLLRKKRKLIVNNGNVLKKPRLEV